jgi:hypothetical protein
MNNRVVAVNDVKESDFWVSGKSMSVESFTRDSRGKVLIYISPG